MNEIINLIKYSGINSLFYTSKNIVSFAINGNSLFLIKLKLNDKQITYIERNNVIFIKAIIVFLNSFNSLYDTKYSNITYNSVKVGKKVFNNCIILFNSKKYNKGYVYTDNIKINTNNLLINNNLSEDEKIYLEIINLLKNKNISVRNLLKIGLKQKIAREVFNYLKNINIFSISKNNINHKLYNLENIEKIDKYLILEKINKSV